MWNRSFSSKGRHKPAIQQEARYCIWMLESQIDLLCFIYQLQLSQRRRRSKSNELVTTLQTKPSVRIKKISLYTKVCHHCSFLPCSSTCTRCSSSESKCPWNRPADITPARLSLASLSFLHVIALGSILSLTVVMQMPRITQKVETAIQSKIKMAGEQQHNIVWCHRMKIIHQRYCFPKNGLTSTKMNARLKIHKSKSSCQVNPN